MRPVGRQARVAKEAAEGAYITGKGLLGGKYKGIVESLQLRQAEARCSIAFYLRELSWKSPKVTILASLPEAYWGSTFIGFNNLPDVLSYFLIQNWLYF